MLLQLECVYALDTFWEYWILGLLPYGNSVWFLIVQKYTLLKPQVSFLCKQL